MKRLSIISLVAVCHLALSVFIGLRLFSMGMSRFDTGAPPSPLEHIVVTANSVLTFPLVFLVMRVPGNLFPGLFGYIPFAANSILWAVCLYWIGAFLYKRLTKRSSELPPATAAAPRRSP